MAANTTINFSLQFRDWKSVYGVIDNSPLPEIQRLKNRLIIFLDLNPLVVNADVVVIATKEKALIAIFRQCIGGTFNHLWEDNSTATPGNRICAAITAANNIADNYIQTELATIRTANQANQTTIRNNGGNILNPNESL